METQYPTRMGDEVALAHDGSGSKTVGTRTQDLLIYEQRFGADSIELRHVDRRPAKRTRSVTRERSAEAPRRCNDCTSADLPPAQPGGDP